MNVLLQFDYEESLLYIPDGYIRDIHRVHQEFFPWLYEQANSMVESEDGQPGCAYCANEFCEYTNSIVLKDSSERILYPARAWPPAAELLSAIRTAPA